MGICLWVTRIPCGKPVSPAIAVPNLTGPSCKDALQSGESTTSGNRTPSSASGTRQGRVFFRSSVSATMGIGTHPLGTRQRMPLSRLAWTEAPENAAGPQYRPYAPYGGIGAGRGKKWPRQRCRGQTHWAPKPRWSANPVRCPAPGWCGPHVPHACRRLLLRRATAGACLPRAGGVLNYPQRRKVGKEAGCQCAPATETPTGAPGKAKKFPIRLRSLPL